MADDLAVPRCFLANASDEVVKLVIELGDEQAAAAAVGSVADAIDRISVITSRLAEIDPFYQYDMRTGPDV
jgi:hypothetical protein